MQRPDHWLDGLRVRPFWRREDVPWVAELERRLPEIRAELLAARGGGGAAAADAGGRWDDVGSVQSTDLHDEKLVEHGGRWQEFVLLGAAEGYDGQQRRN